MGENNPQVRPVYVHDSFHWLRGDYGGGILAFHTKKIEAIFIDLTIIISCAGN